MRSLLFLFLLVAALNTDHIYCENKKTEAADTRVYKAINIYRDKLKVPPLEKSEELAKGCFAYAKHLATLNIKDQMLHSETKTGGRTLTMDHMDYPLSDPKNTNYTENIAEVDSKLMVEAVAYWVVKGADCYVIDEEDRSKVEQSLADKYTALLWKSSTKVGVGMAPKEKNNKKGRWILVIRFAPPGNQRGEYDENISWAHAAFGEDRILETSTSLSVERQGPVSWIYIVLFIQNYLMVTWVNQISN